MAIRPLDMQVMIPRLQEVSNIKQTENQRAGVSQNQIANSMNKEATHNQQSVVSSHKDQEADHHADAKEESKNKYGYKKPNKHQKKKEDEPDIEGSYHKIDIKI